MKLFKSALVALVAVFATLNVVQTAEATGTGMVGCTPGYWKNHTDSWEEASSGDLLSSIYSGARANVAGKTLLEALQGGGGPGADGAAVILARAATAAWLNAANDGVGYPWRREFNGLGGRPPLVAYVNAAFASGSRATMIEAASRLDGDNNLAQCPLN